MILGACNGGADVTLVFGGLCIADGGVVKYVCMSKGGYMCEVMKDVAEYELLVQCVHHFQLVAYHRLVQTPHGLEQ